MNEEKTALLQTEDLHKARSIMNKAVYRRSTMLALAWYIFDLCLYLAPMLGIFIVNNNWLKILFGLIAGIAVSNMFVWAHDAAHGTLFKNKILSEILGTIFMLPSLNIYKLWCYGHNKVHHGFTGFVSLDWIWRPLTREEYRAQSSYQKFSYRLERNLYTCAWHYLVKVWWDKMIFFKPGNLSPKERIALLLSKYVTAVFAITLGIMLYVYSGIIGVITGLIMPFLIFNYFIAFYVYLHHTHPKVAFFDKRQEWNHAVGMIQCTTVIRCPWWVELLNHNILIHTPHHIDTRIPFYHLQQAYHDLKLHYFKYINEYQFNWREVAKIFKQCKFYDYQAKKWYSFAEIDAI